MHNVSPFNDTTHGSSEGDYLTNSVMSEDSDGDTTLADTWWATAVSTKAAGKDLGGDTWVGTKQCESHMYMYILYTYIYNSYD